MLPPPLMVTLASAGFVVMRTPWLWPMSPARERFPRVIATAWWGVTVMVTRWRLSANPSFRAVAERTAVPGAIPFTERVFPTRSTSTSSLG